MEIVYKVVAVGIICICFTESVEGEKFILTNPDDLLQIIEGQTVEFKCSITQVEPRIKFENLAWLKDSTVVPNDPRHTIDYNEYLNIYSLKIKEVRKTDAGYYQCRVNRIIENSTKAELTVKTKLSNPICEAYKTGPNKCTVEAKCITEDRWNEDAMRFYIITKETSKNQEIPVTSHGYNDTHRWALGSFLVEEESRKIKIGCKVGNRSCENPVELEIFSNNTIQTTTQMVTEKENKTTEKENKTTEKENKTTEKENKITEQSQKSTFYLKFLIISIVFNVIFVIYFFTEKYIWKAWEYFRSSDSVSDPVEGPGLVGEKNGERMEMIEKTTK